jgi:hypothetical protein
MLLSPSHTRSSLSDEGTLMTSPRRTASLAGVLYLLTHVTSIATVAYGPVLTDPGYITGTGPDTQLLLGSLFEVVLAMAVVGTAVVLFPVLRLQNEGLALGYVGLRVLEGAVIAVGVVPLLAVAALRQDLAGAAGTEDAALVTVGQALVALHDGAFVVGQGFVIGVSTVVTAYLVYRSQLVPRLIPVLGLVGGPLILAGRTAMLFGYEPSDVLMLAVVLPIFAWEVGLALYLVVKGFRPAALARLSLPRNATPSVPAAA